MGNDTITSDNDTPLVWAICEKNVDAVQLLLEAKADPNLKDPKTIRRTDSMLLKPAYIPGGPPPAERKRYLYDEWAKGNYTPLHHVADKFMCTLHTTVYRADGPSYHGEYPDIAITKLLIGARADVNQTCDLCPPTKAQKRVGRMGDGHLWDDPAGVFLNQKYQEGRGDHKDDQYKGKAPLDIMTILRKQMEDRHVYDGSDEEPEQKKENMEDRLKERKVFDEMIA